MRGKVTLRDASLIKLLDYAVQNACQGNRYNTIKENFNNPPKYKKFCLMTCNC